MRRRLLAAVWIVGATIPMLAASVFLFGCCVLPFHRVLHDVMPLCHMVAPPGQPETGDSTPAREKEQPVRRIASEMPSSFRLVAESGRETGVAPAAATAYRSYISLGAVRCDRDVGLHVMDSTLLI
jgi:hypothetical protein